MRWRKQGSVSDVGAVRRRQPLIAHDPATGRREVACSRSLAHSRRGNQAAGHRGLCILGRRRTAADLHQQQAGLARQLARRLLGARSVHARTQETGRRIPPATTMFATFSPDGKRVAYVHQEQSLRAGPCSIFASLPSPRMARTRSSTGRLTGSTRKNSTFATVSAGARTASPSPTGN